MDCGEIQESHEAERGFVVSCGDPAEVFELVEHALDDITFFAKLRIVLTLHFPIGFWWNDNESAHIIYRLNDVIRIIAFIRQHSIGVQSLQQRQCLLAVGSLPACQYEAYRISKCVTYCVHLRAEAAFAAAYRLILLPPFAPAACWWARTMVESIISHSVSAHQHRHS